MPVVPDLIDLFLSGLLFLLLYGWLNTEKYNISLLTIWGLFISFIIKNLYGVLPVNLPKSVMSIIYILTGIVLAVILTLLKRLAFVNKIVSKINNKTLDDDIFDNVIDYEKQTFMAVYLKASDIYYLGRFTYREEKGNSSWICLSDYGVIKKGTDEEIYDPDKANLKSSVVIPLSNVERIELIYENDSEVWEQMH